MVGLSPKEGTDIAIRVHAGMRCESDDVRSHPRSALLPKNLHGSSIKWLRWLHGSLQVASSAASSAASTAVISSCPLKASANEGPGRRSGATSGPVAKASGRWSDRARSGPIPGDTTASRGVRRMDPREGDRAVWVFGRWLENRLVFGHRTTGFLEKIYNNNNLERQLHARNGSSSKPHSLQLVRAR